MLLHKLHWNKRLHKFSVFQLLLLLSFKEPHQNILQQNKHQLDFLSAFNRYHILPNAQQNMGKCCQIPPWHTTEPINTEVALWICSKFFCLFFLKTLSHQTKWCCKRLIYNIWGKIVLLKHIQLSELCLLKLWHLDTPIFCPFPWVHCWGQSSHWVPW